MFELELERAERAIDDRRVPEAEEIIRTVLRDRPESVRALELLADIRLRQRKHDEAMAFIARGMEIEPDDPRLLNLRGKVHHNEGDLAAAESDFRAALARDPHFAEVLSNLAHVLLRRGEVVEAEDCLQRALARDPEHGLANLNLGALVLERGDALRAIRLLEKGLEKEMTHRAGRYNLALAQHQAGLLDQAVRNYRQAIASGLADADSYSNLAAALQALGDVDGAIAGFRAALECEPGHGPALAGLAGLMEITGRADKGIALLGPYIRAREASPAMEVAYAQLLRREGRPKEALVQLAPVAKGEGLRDDERMMIHFTLGDLLDELGEYDRAFAHYRVANGLKQTSYTPEARHREVTRLMAVFSAEGMAQLARADRKTRAPVFIIGMPRSGTSLVEQVLASHPLVYGAGELQDLGLVALALGRNKERIPYPECLNRLDGADLKAASSPYLARLESAAPEALRFTDKMWQNFEHLGLIELMIPRARIIHCRRDPVDTGLSCYMQSFGTAGPPFAYELEHIASYYHEYCRLMDHWKAVSKLDMIDVDYEAMVRDLEGEARRLVDFIELDWDPACLRFYDNPRIVRTASHAQVRRPVYTSSVGRAQRYARHIGPLVDALERYGHGRN